MKKSAKKILCLMLIVLLISSMAVPAAAQSGTGTSQSGYSYNWEVYHSDTYGFAQINTNARPTDVTASGRNWVYDDLNDEAGYSERSTVTGYAGATATPNNIINIGTEDDPTYVRGIVQVTYGTFYVGSEKIGENLSSG